MDAQVKHSLADAYRAIDRCAIEIHEIRTRHWSDSPERDNHQKFTEKKHKDMLTVAERVVPQLEGLKGLELSRDSRDPANKELNKLFEQTWLLGLRQLAIAGSPDARRMLGQFQEGRRSGVAIAKARAAVARGKLSRIGDDG